MWSSYSCGVCCASGISFGLTISLLMSFSFNSFGNMTIDQKSAMKQFGNVDTDAKTSMSASRRANKDDEIFIEHQEVNLKFNNCEEREGPHQRRFKLLQYLKGRLSYARLWGCTRKILQRGKASPSRFSLQYVELKSLPVCLIVDC
ncbi:hypothetical protein LIER_00766 [Lithospermum erythrorhizon]|uniref:Uncharacterized protein n=1 Tax=Lithospermum erythrorhizon TaxID=34254 RepID=A0AAV3NIH0_LITER